ncbi:MULTISPECIES: maltotransferase domain-containing protein [unclassified Nocardioides]|uniref:maltotransferase domain-containing protein n=1 Tax=unclassified Nocardioides TaxID=2615069 RepID=UPI0006FD6AAC|nr:MULTISPECIES: maltotransferase domain-containing protein [unclassified Nocardioides]KRA29494.1 alpha-1,4-glucan--maltose-1-phosphate maltosyltransferase [Nocardioides sp. Root614]KRA88331.1 alpha-1,4-glucan--maltose-1-phosphate maltosyltransferase [Nocardioides sp. Root682]
MVGRIPVIDIEPLLAAGATGDRLAAKASIGEPFPVRATVFREGHDRLGAEVVLIAPDGTRQPPARMSPVVATDRHSVDRHEAWVQADAVGPWTFEVHAWSDPIASWQHAAGIKIRADIDTELMFAEGRLLLERVAGLTKAEQRVVQAAIKATGDKKRPAEARLAQLESPELVGVLRAHPLRDLLTVEGPFPVYVDRPRALFGSWYEFFPRSEGAHFDPQAGDVVSGTFRTAAERLPAVAAMGFDVVYLPPIHPIGEVNRKGPNNTVLAEGEPLPPDWTGSPWAIGSAAGGHDAVHPDLGTLEDFDAFVAAAAALDLEVALDLALQAAPDHPWVAAHPEWFTTRADGSIAYAENPPKKYQDIYPVNFDAHPYDHPDSLATEVLRVVRHWMAHGVRIFRVDNPHTKPVAFWEWLLAEVRQTDPDVLFLAEAFTKPPMMQTLGAIGFHQSYTYFTWRTAKVDIEDYLREVSHESAHRMRPNFFVNTPDILHEFLQYGGTAAFRIRAVLAAMSSPTWGMYAGYELGEHVAVKPGSEEYLDSEKYQIRVRDWGPDATGLASYVTRLNAIRRAHPALQLLRNLTVHPTDEEHVLCFSKASRYDPPRSSAALLDDLGDRVIVVLNLDPHQVRETMVHLDLAALGLAPGSSFAVHDEISGADWTWGADNYVRLDPTQPAHILSVKGHT